MPLIDLVTIGRDRLAHSPSNRLEDVLRDVPGFQQFRRSDARSANPTSQGATLRALGGNASSRVLLLLDGVPQTDPFGGWICLAGLRSAPARPGARDARRRHRRQRPGRARRHDRARQRRAGRSGGARRGLALRQPRQRRRLRRAMARGSAPGFAQPFRPPMPAATASFPSSRASAARPTAPRPTSRRASPCAASLPLSAAVELQANVSAFTDERERGTAFSEIDTRGADASLRLVGRGRLPFSALAYVQVRDFRNRFAAVSADRATRDARRSTSIMSLRPGSAPASRSGRALGPVALRLGADWRATEGRTQELFQFVAGAPTRGRVAGGRTTTLGAFAEASLEIGSAHPHRRRADRPLADRKRAPRRAPARQPGACSPTPLSPAAAAGSRPAASAWPGARRRR